MLNDTLKAANSKFAEFPALSLSNDTLRTKTDYMDQSVLINLNSIESIDKSSNNSCRITVDSGRVWDIALSQEEVINLVLTFNN